MQEDEQNGLKIYIQIYTQDHKINVSTIQLQKKLKQKKTQNSKESI